MCLSGYVQGNVKSRGGMKAKTKIEREVLAMCEALPKLTDAQVRWARTRLHDHEAYYLKTSGTTWCQECGHVWVQSVPELHVSIHGNCVCPHCGKEVRMAHYMSAHIKDGGRRDEQLFAVVTAHKEWTVVRVFMSERVNRLGMPWRRVSTQYDEYEVWQQWIRDDGKEVITTKRYHRSPYYFQWSYDSAWGIGKHNGGCSGYFVTSDVYDLTGVIIYPVVKVSDIMRRNGFTRALADYCGGYLVELMKGLLTDSLTEWLAKVGQYDVLKHDLRHNGTARQWYHALKVCARNGYHVCDPAVYYDYLSQLREFGKDTHSPKYVCPKDLYHEHDKYSERQTRKEVEQMAKEAAKYENGYRQRVGMFFGVVFGNDDIVVTVIGSVAEMAEEGLRLHHCVFANKYYAKKDTLILSARTKGGGRLETVEVDTKRWEVVQSRGLLNNPSERHAEIVELVKENMYQLKKCV